MPMERDMIFTWRKSTIAMAPILKAFLLVFLSLSVSADDSSGSGLSSLTDGGPWFTADSAKGSIDPKDSKDSKDPKDVKLPKMPKIPDFGNIFGGGSKDKDKAKGKDKDKDKDKGGAAAAGAGAGAGAGDDDAKVDPSGTGAPIIGPDKPRFESESLGTWRITTPNVGVSAMQLQTMPFDKIVWFDTTFLGPSALQWTPPGNCPLNFETNLPDCCVHCLEYDGLKDTTRPLTVCKLHVSFLLNYTYSIFNFLLFCIYLCIHR